MNRIITILLFACVFIFSACIKDPVFDQIEYVNTLDANIDVKKVTFSGEYCVEDNGEKNTWECAVRIGYDSLLKDSWIVCSKSTSDDFYKHKPANNVKQFTVEIEPNVYDTTYYYCAFMQKGDKELAAGDVRKIYFGRPDATITTIPVSDITATSATCGGIVNNSGNASVTARGVCWSTSHNPTINGPHTNDGSGTGNFTSTMTGLAPNTTYYVRAYATNSDGTAYGNEVSFTTLSLQLPTVATSAVSGITANSADCGGNVTSNGNATVTARGVCWSTSHNPTISNSHTTNGSGTGSFTSSMTGLSANTTYYVRAYATNSVGTAYGEERTFTTPNAFDQNGASNAVFTVSSGRRVHFSRGNLQYQASTGTWRFAEHQYDYVGAANSNISSSYSGWIDLFGWGTSGWNSGANAYQPWATSTSYSDYWPGGSRTNSLTGEYANADWGVYNRISNGGNQAGRWRTLTNVEWEYLITARSASTVVGTANARYAKATVNGTSGVIIFPDTFTLPTGMTVTNVNNSSGAYTSNTYTSSQWGQLEAAGCIFLPAAGYRYGTDVYGVGAGGNYWSSSYGNEGCAWGVNFGSGSVFMSNYGCSYGLSVRLVRD